MAVIALYAIFLCPTAVSMKSPDEYGYNECELTAKDFHNEFGGSLVFIQPLKTNGAYDLSDYGGHFINKRYVSGNKQEFFFDGGIQKIFSSQEEMETWYEDIYFGTKVETFELDKRYPPFGIIWRY